MPFFFNIFVVMIYVACLLVVAIWLFSFFRFRRQLSIHTLLCDFTRRNHIRNHNTKTAVEFGCALMLCQKYQSAITLFNEAKQFDPNYKTTIPFLEENIAFCRKPLPWSRGPKDHKGSWRHNLLLVRIGARRFVAISNETILDFNAFCRQLERTRS